VGNLTTHAVDPAGHKMSEAEYLEAIRAIGGDNAQPGEQDFERVAVVARDEEQARHAFVELMQRFIGDGGKVVWQQRPTVGPRRTYSGVEHVVTARFKIVE
jgi:hypothetical protein